MWSVICSSNNEIEKLTKPDTKVFDIDNNNIKFIIRHNTYSKIIKELCILDSPNNYIFPDVISNIIIEYSDDLFTWKIINYMNMSGSAYTKEKGYELFIDIRITIEHDKNEVDYTLYIIKKINKSIDYQFTMHEVSNVMFSLDLQEEIVYEHDNVNVIVNILPEYLYNCGIITIQHAFLIMKYVFNND